MVLHELFKNIGEEYTEVEGVPKRYRCTLTLDGRPFQIDSLTKKAAKQKCAELVLRELHPDVDFLVAPERYNTQGPCVVLHAMVNKQSRQETKITYEFKDNVPPVAGQPTVVFYCDCVIDEKDRYTGSGRSKKLAKNEAAMIALKKIFKIDFDPSSCYPLALRNRAMTESKVSPMCRTISEFCKREYHQMCEFYQTQPSNMIACFVLINEKDEKHLISVGSSIQYIVEPDTLNGANGTAILHFDPLVLARRGLVRNLLIELDKLSSGASETSIFERKEDGKAALKSKMRLVLYSNYSPVCTYSADVAIFSEWMGHHVLAYV